MNFLAEVRLCAFVTFKENISLELPAMTSHAHASNPRIEGKTSQPSKLSAPRSLLRTDLLVYFTIALMTGSAWWIASQTWYTSWSRTGYWLGVTGGVLMILLFTYPIRKRWRLTFRWGPARYWFIAHMCLGVLGPWFILLHSKFQIGSTNAAVALYSMIIVALSGVAGRFLYVRLHAGLRGEKASVETTRRMLEQQHLAAGQVLGQYPHALSSLYAFEASVLDLLAAKRKRDFWRLFVLPTQRRRVVQQCLVDVDPVIRRMSREHHLSLPRAKELRQDVAKQINALAFTLQRAAQIQTFERLFSLWHIAHVPFVWIMVFCAIFHVVAVHAY